MSAEGKKKRGEAGQSNAKTIAFRYGGSKCDLSTRTGSTTHPRLGGARFFSAMAMGSFIKGFNPSQRMMDAVERAMDHCTVDRPI